MKIGIANDHRGVILKQSIMNFLRLNGYDVINYGTDSDDSVDYTDYAVKLGKAISSKEIDLGIAICGTGIGMSIALNKMNEVMCAKVDNKDEARLCKEHNDCNVISLPATMDSEFAKDIVNIFITTDFSNDKRHIVRINKIREIENA